MQSPTYISESYLYLGHGTGFGLGFGGSVAQEMRYRAGDSSLWGLGGRIQAANPKAKPQNSIPDC